MSDSITITTSQLHDKLRNVLLRSRGKTIGLRAARESLLQTYPDLKDKLNWVMLSDHCSNHIVKGSCNCAGTESALVERIERGKYRVL